MLFLYIKKPKKTYKNASIIKKTYIKKLENKNKLLFYNLTKFEKKLFEKVKNNFVLLKKSNFELVEEMGELGLNKNFSTIKIDICDSRNFSKLSRYLFAVKKFEGMSYFFNIIILFSRVNDIFYNDVFSFCSRFKLRSVIKIIDEEFLSVKNMSLINILNIDREVEICDCPENTCAVVGNKKYYFGFEEYKNFSFKSEISDLDFYIQKTRMVDFENSCVVEKFCFENLSKKELKLSFWYVLKVFKSKKQKYLLGDFYKFKNCFLINDKKLFVVDNISFDRKVLQKNKIVLGKKLSLKPGRILEFCVVKSKNKYENLVLENVVSVGNSFVVNKYLKLPKLKIMTPNNGLNRLINFHLPQEIIKNYIFSPEKNDKDFKDFLGGFLSKDLCLNDSFKNVNFFFLPQKSLGFVYQNLMYNLLGLCFLKEGVFINPLKKNVLGDATVFYKYMDEEICFEIKKTNENSFSYKIGGVEFSNIDVISYDTLLKQKNIVLHL